MRKGKTMLVRIDQLIPEAPLRSIQAQLTTAVF